MVTPFHESALRSRKCLLDFLDAGVMEKVVMEKPVMEKPCCLCTGHHSSGTSCTFGRITALVDLLLQSRLV